MKLFKILFSLVLIVNVSNVLAHKSYISIANMEYNSKQDQIEVSLKLTAHDFEYILEKKFNKRIHIENVKDSSTVGLFIQNYITKHFQVYSQKKQTKFNYVGKEVTVRDELYFYFTFTQVLDPLHIWVSDTFLFDLFSKQQNIIHYKIKDKTKSVTLIPSKRGAKIWFN